MKNNYNAVNKNVDGNLNINDIDIGNIQALTHTSYAGAGVHAVC